jgi:KaiC/GvpD/RAD55 family RecA-like ATPase
VDFLERVKTGIKGLDDIMQGGIPKGSNVLLSGGSGTCKTITGLSFIYNGAKDFGEPGLFVSMEENIKNIVWNMESFGWDIKQLQDSNLMKIYKLKLSPKNNIEKQIEAELKTISSIIKEIGAKRLVVDSTTAFAIWLGEPGLIRSVLYEFVDGLKELGCTTLLISETKGDRLSFSAFGVEEFVADGVIALYFTPPHRSVFVRKMRGTNHSKSVHPFEISSKGIAINPKDKIMWEAIK